VKHRQLEEEYETLKGELHQLKEVATPKAFSLYVEYILGLRSSSFPSIPSVNFCHNKHNNG